MPPHGTGTVAPYSVHALGSTIQVDSPLSGAHQHRNLALAMAAAVELATNHSYPITATAIAEGIHNTRWPARLERVQKVGVEWILDVAHNPAGAWALRSGLSGLLNEERPRCLIFSCLRDKPVAEMAQILFPLFDQVIIPPILTARAAPLDVMLEAAKSTGTPAFSAESVSQALEYAQDFLRQNHAQNGQIVISGSVYLVGEARTLLLAPAQCASKGSKQ
jgi:dihydrofolate synthase/folylpolyglutamate synthase